MADFHERLCAVHAEVREAGHSASFVLDCMLRALASADLPQGVRRLPTARMRPGPHLAPQDEAGVSATGDIEVRRARAQRRRLAAR